MTYRHSSQELALEVSQFSETGHGLGHWITANGSNRLVEIPFSLPSEHVHVTVLGKKKKNCYTSRVITRSVDAPHRITAPCRHFGLCGGCVWQHLSSADQLHLKERRIHNLLSPLATAQTHWHPILPSPALWHYRNKMELSFSTDRYGNRYLGLIAYGTRGHVFQMEECLLASSWMATAQQVISAWWHSSGIESYHPMRNRGALRTITLRTGEHTGDRLIMLTVSSHPDDALTRSQLNQFTEQIVAHLTPHPPSQLSVFVRIQQVIKGSPTHYYEMLLHGPDHIREQLYLTGQSTPLTLHISPSAFFQPNTRQAERLYSRVVEMAQLSPSSLIYDLYCGAGTLGMCFAPHVEEVVGIELSPESSLDGRENIRLNGMTNVSIRTGDVAQLLPLLYEEKRRRPDVVVVDPPRAGLTPKALTHILALQAPQVLYVSCNPTTQAANLEHFVQAGYRLHAVQPIDQFPQTFHVENIVHLIR